MRMRWLYKMVSYKITLNRPSLVIVKCQTKLNQHFSCVRVVFFFFPRSSSLARYLRLHKGATPFFNAQWRNYTSSQTTRYPDALPAGSTKLLGGTCCDIIRNCTTDQFLSLRRYWTWRVLGLTKHEYWYIQFNIFDYTRRI